MLVFKGIYQSKNSLKKGGVMDRGKDVKSSMWLHYREYITVEKNKEIHTNLTKLKNQCHWNQGSTPTNDKIIEKNRKFLRKEQFARLKEYSN